MENMDLRDRIIKRYGSIKNFCEANGLNYGGFRVQMSMNRVYGKNKEALIKNGIVKDERELNELLFARTQARNLIKEAQ